MNKSVTTRDRIVFWGTCLGYGAFFLFIGIAKSVPRASKNKYVNRRVAATLYTSKWDLYTGSPLVPPLRLYAVQGSRLVPVDVRPFTREYLFGLNRRSKVIAEEVVAVTKDTIAIAAMKQYKIDMPAGADINSYLRADTLQYTAVKKPEITYLRGQYVITSEAPDTWEEVRAHTARPKVVQVFPINISNP